MPNSHSETSAAMGARLEFLIEAVQRYQAPSILDIGCGTGEFTTAPLARQFPNATIVGVDEDQQSLDYARKKFSGLSNVSWSATVPPGQTFDLVIASEVIEHVADPESFLDYLKSLVRPGGRLIATFPNGYGCHEIMSTLEAALHVSGLIPLLKKVIRRSTSPSPSQAAQDTLAVSPHINFFSYGKAIRLFRDRGLFIEAYRGRMFLYNFIASVVIDRFPRLVQWNIALGRHLPPRWVADWMFILKPSDRSAPLRPYRRNAYERFKVWLNCRRWKVPIAKEWLA